ncbi:nuclear transport factor 2 family protein [Paludisphaera rhizosphaerae]|uniref:hypothetical protein n=1 Tax=Paludisphaera rhizosphaerae TaxID=2711216 RepID=UPI0013ECB1E8|nr:hypothetical protein [Paludisphaera rhizosphaerae]
MSMFSDDPTWPVGALLFVAALCFVGLRVRQEGKYLIWGLTALGLAALVLTVEWMWVTDEERIEAVVYDLRRALLASDADGVLAHLTPDVQYVQSGEPRSSNETRNLIRNAMDGSKLDIVRIRELQTSAGRLTKRGKAEFKALVKGTVQGPFGFAGSGGSDSTWSLGFEQTKSGVWKVNRITPVATSFNPSILNAPSVHREFGRSPGFNMEGGMMDPALGGSPPAPGGSDGRRQGPFRLDRKHLGSGGWGRSGY